MSDTLNVKEIIDKADSLIDKDIDVLGWLCDAPEQMPSNLPLPVLSFVVLQGNICFLPPNCFKSDSINIKLYKLYSNVNAFNINDSLYKLFRPFLCKQVVIGAFLRKITVNYTPPRPFIYLEVNSIDSISASGVKAIQRQIKKNGLNNIRMNRFFSSGYPNESLEIFDIRGKAITVHFLSKAINTHGIYLFRINNEGLSPFVSSFLVIR